MAPRAAPDRAPASPDATNATPLRTRVENLPFVVMRVMRDGTFLHVGEHAEALTGYDRETILQPRFGRTLIHPDDRDVLTRALRQIGLDGQTTIRVQLICADGATRDVEIHLTASGDMFDGVVYDLRAETDLAEGIRVRSRYDEAEPALRNAALASADVLTFLEAAVALVGQAAGADRAHVLLAGDGDTLLSVAFWMKEGGRRPEPIELDPALWPELIAGRVVKVSADESAPAEALIRETGCTEVILVPFRDDGERDGAFLLESDTPMSTWGTFESRSLARLARLFETLWAWMGAEARYSNTLADLEDGLFNFGYDANGARRYALVAPQFEAITGCDAGALLAEGETEPRQHWRDLVHADDIAEFDKHEAALRSGERSRLEYRITRPDNNSVRWLRESATPSLSPSGRAVVGGLVSDVTERKHAEASLLQAKQAAEQASQAKTVFMATMSHEIRSPLGAIRGFAELLGEEVREMQEAGNAPPEQFAEFAGIIAENTTRVLHLVHNLFDLSRLEAGTLDLRRVPVELHAAIESVLSRYQPAAEEKGLAVRFERAQGDPVLLGDPERLEQIVEHLISNAVKFTDEGSITIRTKIDGSKVILQVEDTGIGIAPQYLDELFEPFSQEDYRLNRAYEGSGLGLAITRKLLEGMDAIIHVDSEKGRGSCFEVTFEASRTE